MKPTAKPGFLSLSSLVLVGAASLPCQAQTAYQWNGTTNSTFTTASNWTSSTIMPFNGTSNSRLNVNNSDPARPLTYSSAQGTTIYSGGAGRALVIASGTAGNMVISGGTFDSRQATEDVLVNGAFAGSLTLSGGHYINTNGGSDVFLVGLNAGASPGAAPTIHVNSGSFTSGRVQFGQNAGIGAGGIVGTVNLNGGTLSTKQFHEQGALNNFGDTGIALISSTVNFNGGTLRPLENGTIMKVNAVDNAVVQAGGAIIDTNGFNTAIDKVLSAGSPSGGLTKQGSGTLTLNAINTYTGTTTVSAGTLALGHASNTLSNSAPVQVSGGVLSLGASSDTVGAVTLGSGSITSTSGVLTGSSYSVESGTVSAILGGSGALTKSTAGTVTLTRANTYSGATNVNAGMLHVSGAGSINNSSGITVNGGHFKYNSSTNLTAPLTLTSGTVSGTNLSGVDLTIGAGSTISPGNSPGTMNLDDQTWAAGGSYLLEIHDATGVAGTGWDLLSGTGTLNVTATLGSEFIIDLSTLSAILPSDIAGDALNFNPTSSYAWLIADFAAVTGFNSTDFTIDAGGFTNALSGGAFGISLGGVGTVPGDSSQVYLTFTAIPEPGAALLGGLGVLALLRRRRSA